MKQALIIPAVLAVFWVLACERDTVSQANRGPLSTAPEYEITARVSTLPASSNIAEVAPAIKQASLLDAEALYSANCAACHQANGQGIPGAFPPLAGSPYVLSENTERMAAIMVYGLIGPVRVLGVQYNSAMAPLGATLNDEQLAAVGSYVRRSWGNSAPAVGAEVFAQVRAKYGSRGPFNIQELGEEK
jgi:mono/diheme cytochrome c family protein